jgi:putative endonuclease
VDALKGRFFIAETGVTVYFQYMILKRRFHPKNIVGNRGEDEASSFLRSIGYAILERNYRNDRGHAVGEIDIVAKDGDQLVFVEVKTRTAADGREPCPEANITFGKLRKLERIVSCYLRERRCESTAYRFDAVSVVYDRSSSSPEIRHFKGIFL